MTDKEMKAIVDKLYSSDEFIDEVIAVALLAIAKTFGNAKEETEE